MTHLPFFVIFAVNAFCLVYPSPVLFEQKFPWSDPFVFGAAIHFFKSSECEGKLGFCQWESFLGVCKP